MKVPATPEFLFGALAYGFAGIFTLLNVGALFSTWRTKRFSSGVHLVPTMAAVVGKLTAWSWTSFFVVAALDLGGLVLAAKIDPRPAESKRP